MSTDERKSVYELHCDIAELKAENERLRRWIQSVGGDYDICTYPTLGKLCDGCRCERGEKE